jgi:hypothetical protein
MSNARNACADQRNEKDTRSKQPREHESYDIGLTEKIVYVSSNIVN